VWGLSPHLGNTSAVLNVTASGNWVASSDQPWAIVGANGTAGSTFSGSGNGTLSVDLFQTEQYLPLATNISTVENGVYTANITVSDGTTSIVVPVSFQVGLGSNMGTKPTHY